MTGLRARAFGGLLVLVVAMGAMLFIPAWSLRYWQAWVFIAVFSTSVFAITLYLMKNDPKLLERRVSAGPGAEKESSQRVIQAFAQVGFISALILPALDHRFGWSHVPIYMVALGDILVALGLFIVFLVFKENTFTSAVIEVEPEQKVVATGPYAFVRHPMYAGALVMLIGMPLALGSWWGLVATIAMTFVIVSRLLGEERYLTENLPGYAAYRSSVKYRLIPLIW